MSEWPSNWSFLKCGEKLDRVSWNLLQFQFAIKLPSSAWGGAIKRRHEALLARAAVITAGLHYTVIVVIAWASVLVNTANHLSLMLCHLLSSASQLRLSSTDVLPFCEYRGASFATNFLHVYKPNIYKVRDAYIIILNVLSTNFELPTVHSWIFKAQLAVEFLIIILISKPIVYKMWKKLNCSSFCITSHRNFSFRSFNLQALVYRCTWQLKSAVGLRF